MSGRVLDHARALAVLERGRLLEHARALVAGAGEGGVDVRYAPLDQRAAPPAAGRDLVAANVRHHDRAIVTGPHLRAVTLADPHPLAEPEGGLQPGHRFAH